MDYVIGQHPNPVTFFVNDLAVRLFRRVEPTYTVDDERSPHHGCRMDRLDDHLLFLYVGL
jgi:hypothetical protein